MEGGVASCLGGSLVSRMALRVFSAQEEILQLSCTLLGLAGF